MPDTRTHWKTVRCKNKYTSLCLENRIIKFENQLKPKKETPISTETGAFLLSLLM